MAKSLPVSPLAPERFPEIPSVRGARWASLPAGLRYRGRDDLMLLELAPGSSAAGVLTRSTTAGHPVLWCRAVLPRGKARAVIVNAGNANVFRGAEGDAAVRGGGGGRSPRALGCAPEEVLGRLDRRHRRPCRSSASPPRCPTSPRPCGADGIEGRRPGDHDHRHLPEGRVGPRRGRRPPSHRRHRQGRGHDRARHGDNARLRRHRRRIAPAPAGAPRRGRRPLVQRDHRRQRHLDLRHAAALRHRRGRARAIVEPAIRAPPVRRGARRPLLDLAPGRPRRRGRAEVHRIGVEGAAVRRAARRSAWRSPTRRWSRPPSPARTPTGAASSWRSARRASGDRDKLDVAFGGRVARDGGGACPTTTRPRSPPI